MTSSLIRRPFAVTAIAGTAIAMLSTPSQANFFDLLFGGGYQRPAPQYYYPQSSYDRHPLDVQVNPKRRSHGATKVRPGKERAKVANTAIDPRQHPNWYLEDSTLRKGDIVVLPTGVMVYQGGARPQTREDFAALSQSKLVSKKERERIKDMVGPPTVTAESDETTRNKEATGPTNPIQ